MAELFKECMDNNKSIPALGLASFKTYRNFDECDSLAEELPSYNKSINEFKEND